MADNKISKLFAILSIVVIVSVGCQNGNSVEPFNYERDTPAWLKVKIDSMSTNQYYHGSQVYRYIWRNDFIYDIFIPVSSCVYCEVFNKDGAKITFTGDNMLQDYLNNRKDEILVWEWKD